ncbi:MAG: cell division protein FtsL [Pseudomonadota bacterium]
MTAGASTISTAVPMFSAVRHQPVAPKSAAVRRRHIRQIAILIFIGVALSLLYVWIRIQVIQLGYEVSRIRKETTELKEQKNRLDAEVASLKSPDRLEAVGRERFGMRLPRSDEIVFVGGSGKD